MTFEDVKNYVSDELHVFDRDVDPKFILIHPEQFTLIMNNVDDNLISYEPTKDRWGRYYFMHMRIIRSIDVNPGEIIVR